MTDLIDRIELMRQIADFGREIPKYQVMEVIARQESVDCDSELINRQDVYCILEKMMVDRPLASDRWVIRNIDKAIKSLPSADRPTGEFDGMIFSTDKYMAFVDKKEIHILRKGAHKVTVERTFNTEDDDE